MDAPVALANIPKGKPNACSTRLMLVMVSDRLIEIEI
ncbi:protein of unknown function [Pseudomonas sp. JV551A1]|nr:protein of unknown function [Pseudomonas sp. JV551A1]